MKPWKRVAPTTITKTKFRAITSKTFILGNGETHTFDTFDTEGREYVATVALTKDNQVIIARQFRPGPEKVLDELPGGYVDAEDKDPAAAVARELQEETGYQVAPPNLHYLGSAPIDPYDNAIIRFYFATDCQLSTAGQTLDTAEEVEVTLISIKQFMDNARTGRMTATQGVLMAYDELRKRALL